MFLSQYSDDQILIYM